MFFSFGDTDKIVVMMLLLERFSQFHILTILLFLIINEDDVNPGRL